VWDGWYGFMTIMNRIFGWAFCGFFLSVDFEMGRRETGWERKKGRVEEVGGGGETLYSF